jgi:hypothetical protein
MFGGVPQHIRSDNGPEFIAAAIRRHGQQASLEMLYIEPGAPGRTALCHASTRVVRLGRGAG